MMGQDVYVVFCIHPESDSIWIESVHRSEPTAEAAKKKLYDDAEGGDGMISVTVEKLPLKD